MVVSVQESASNSQNVNSFIYFNITPPTKGGVFYCKELAMVNRAIKHEYPD